MKSFFKKYWFWVVLAFAIRIFLMPITLHPDIWALSFAEHLLGFRGIVNIYDYLGNLPSDSLLSQNYGTNFFTYPPLAYFSFGFFGFLLRPFFDRELLFNLAENLPNILEASSLGRHLFLMKLPYLFFDLGILFLLVGLFKEPKKKVLAGLLWLYNPLAFYTPYMIGQFDLIPVFFSILALFLAKKEKTGWAAFCLGVGGAYKMFPLFFLPFLAAAEGNFKKRLKIFTIGLLPYLASILPFIGSSFFRQVVLFSNQSQKIFFAKVPISGAEGLSLFLVAYLFLFGMAIMKKAPLWHWFLAVMMLLFSVTHYHPQWFLWLTPFLIIFAVEFWSLAFLPLMLYFGWLGLTLLFEPSLSVSLFAPVSPSLKEIIPLSETLGQKTDVFQFKSLVRSLTAGVSLIIFFALSKCEPKDN
jgi:hypothetical protein